MKTSSGEWLPMRGTERGPPGDLRGRDEIYIYIFLKLIGGISIIS